MLRQNVEIYLLSLCPILQEGGLKKYAKIIAGIVRSFRLMKVLGMSKAIFYRYVKKSGHYN